MILDPPEHPKDAVEWVALDVYGAAQGLRSAHDGSGDPWPDERTAAVLEALEARITTGWRPSSWPERAAGDEGLRAFARSCIDEVRRRRGPVSPNTIVGPLGCPADCDCRGFA